MIDAKRMEKFLLEMGFQIVRQKGSNVFYRHTDERITTVPFHSNKDLARPLIRQILSEIRITVEEYNELLENL